MQELTARIERLRKGDPDLTADELQAAIERAEAKRQELLDQQPAARTSAKVLAMLPKAADLYRRQIELGLRGDERAALKARVFLRELLGTIELKPQGEELWAEYGTQPEALLQVAGLKGLGFSGSGGPISDLFSLPEGADQTHVTREQWRRVGGHSDGLLLSTLNFPVAKPAPAC